MADVLTLPRQLSWGPNDDVDAIVALPSSSKAGGWLDEKVKPEHLKSQITSQSPERPTKWSHTTTLLDVSRDHDLMLTGPLVCGRKVDL